MEAFIGTILPFAGNFAPKGWAICNGQTLSIANYSALFSILGTSYGGDGITTFRLPDLRGRVPMGYGTGDGLTPRELGEQVGAETVAESNIKVGPGGSDARRILADAPSENLSVMQPSLTVNFIICMEGIYPSRG